ncbi:4-hydroxy-tetrahydrodipicolinate reductase [Aquiflexum sp. TKW24L]|uniref:4-hydroxy-tetrahydrodipicolinate reductase n=1 Tax=Aquiflexum sp. TKW24L TaxID=2942212 RepID=UPI0020C0C907|nr:4-hydroxy-tetrahydrodipicolinate reductase [Aquiflexum sp. TKW24L]MCL6260586.1 4-hydroxy-tetrahydrodipicolinate reductase [Aquiflexum sp. TKW24L]
MNILLLGYGKMGKIIGDIAESRGHHIVGKINIENRQDLDLMDLSQIDVAIEFSTPESAVENINWAIERGIPVVSGTTGWLDSKPMVEQLTRHYNTAFFYASNFSIGVNIFFKVNRFLASLMKDQPEYKVSMEEIHHTEKKDAPSGTAITLAEGVIQEIPRINNWTLDSGLVENEQVLPIISKRIDPAPGTHIVRYQSDIDDIKITHTAHSRKGFALGAVLVAEWIKNKKGVLSMDEFLSF